MRLAASRRNSPYTNGNSSSAVPGKGGGGERGPFGSEFMFGSLEFVQAMSSVHCRRTSGKSLRRCLKGKIACCEEGGPFGGFPGGEGRHVVGGWVALLVKEYGEVLCNDFAKEKRPHQRQSLDAMAGPIISSFPANRIPCVVRSSARVPGRLAAPRDEGSYRFPRRSRPR